MRRPDPFGTGYKLVLMGLAVYKVAGTQDRFYYLVPNAFICQTDLVWD